jgi:hypothetical protein
MSGKGLWGRLRGILQVHHIKEGEVVQTRVILVDNRVRLETCTHKLHTSTDPFLFIGIASPLLTPSSYQCRSICSFHAIFQHSISDSLWPPPTLHSRKQSPESFRSHHNRLNVRCDSCTRGVNYIPPKYTQKCDHCKICSKRCGH